MHDLYEKRSVQDQGACKIKWGAMEECLSARISRACEMSVRVAPLWDWKMEMLFFHDVSNKVPSTPLLLQSHHWGWLLIRDMTTNSLCTWSVCWESTHIIIKINLGAITVMCPQGQPFNFNGSFKIQKLHSESEVYTELMYKQQQQSTKIHWTSYFLFIRSSYLCCLSFCSRHLMSTWRSWLAMKWFKSTTR